MRRIYCKYPSRKGIAPRRVHLNPLGIVANLSRRLATRIACKAIRLLPKGHKLKYRLWRTKLAHSCFRWSS